MRVPDKFRSVAHLDVIFHKVEELMSETFAAVAIPQNLSSEVNFEPPEVVVYEHRNWGGANLRTNLNVTWVGDWWNDRISGIIVVRGIWRFYEHRDLQGRWWDLKPGYYEYISHFGIPNDTISSFECISL